MLSDDVLNPTDDEQPSPAVIFSPIEQSPRENRSERKVIQNCNQSARKRLKMIPMQDLRSPLDPGNLFSPSAAGRSKNRPSTGDKPARVRASGSGALAAAIQLLAEAQMAPMKLVSNHVSIETSAEKASEIISRDLASTIPPDVLMDCLGVVENENKAKIFMKLPASLQIEWLVHQTLNKKTQ